MTLHRGGIAPTVGASHDMEPQRQQREEDKNSRPGDLRRADTKQHHDYKTDHSRVQPRPPKRARGRRRHRAYWLAAAAIEPTIQPLENRDVIAATKYHPR